MNVLPVHTVRVAKLSDYCKLHDCSEAVINDLADSLNGHTWGDCDYSLIKATEVDESMPKDLYFNIDI